MLQILWKMLKKEDGQALGLLGLVALGLVVAVVFVYNIGDFFIFLIQEQNAVDAAAISGAAVFADNLNTIVNSNWVLQGSYLGLIGLCWGSCVIPPFTCFACPPTSGLMRITEQGTKIAQRLLKDLSGIRAADEAMQRYRDSGGKGKLYPLSATFTSFKLNELKNTLPKTWPLGWVRGTYYGLAEEERTRGRYDWAGGRRRHPDKKGSYGGFYDTDGPRVDVIARTEYKPPISSWFRLSRSYPFVFKASARPYGGHIHIYKGFRIFGAVFFSGSPTFTAKLVPFGE